MKVTISMENFFFRLTEWTWKSNQLPLYFATAGSISKLVLWLWQFFGHLHFKNGVSA